MAEKKIVQWDMRVLPKNDRPWDTSIDRPLPSPFPHNNDLTDMDEESSDMKSVLSIDGGGIRGYSSLVLLRALHLNESMLTTEIVQDWRHSCYPARQIQDERLRRVGKISRHVRNGRQAKANTCTKTSTAEDHRPKEAQGVRRVIHQYHEASHSVAEYQRGRSVSPVRSREMCYDRLHM